MIALIEINVQHLFPSGLFRSGARTLYASERREQLLLRLPNVEQQELTALVARRQPRPGYRHDGAAWPPVTGGQTHSCA